jgi:DMSO/TMAO reductase YedYZ molybdopterin-dependent catalytic subunit
MMADLQASREARIPPGQQVTKKWPVLTYGATPSIERERWTFQCFGLVELETTWTWADFLQLPRVEISSDIHCVTHWTMLDVRWEGVAIREILQRVGVKPEAQAVLIHADPDYTTNVALEDLMADDVLLALKHNGQDLSADHGGPCRLVIPRLYFWKSAKWVRALEFLEVNPPGFWEQNGYHMRGDPWQEERFTGQETRAMQQMRAEAARKLRQRE